MVLDCLALGVDPVPLSGRSFFFPLSTSTNSSRSSPWWFRKWFSIAWRWAWIPCPCLDGRFSSRSPPLRTPPGARPGGSVNGSRLPGAGRGSRAPARTVVFLPALHLYELLQELALVVP